MDAQGIEQAHLMGESLGGWTSGWLAINHPDRVRSIQLIAAGGTKADPAVMQRIKESTTKAVTSDDIDLTRQRLHTLMFDPERNVSEELVEIRNAIYPVPDFVRHIAKLISLTDMAFGQRSSEERRLGK